MLDPVLCVHHRPRSVEAESFRGVRTALYFSTRGARPKVIQITSPNAQDGKTTLAANLAITLAYAGKRVLLVDADLRKPRIHTLFGVSGDTGLTSLLAEDVEPGDVIQESGIPRLSLLPSGPIPPNPAELLTDRRFKEMLDLLREQYDFVIVDSCPLLAVTDPSVVAPQVDGVLLAVRMDRNSRPAAERAREILKTVGGKVIGVVVNGVSRQADADGYGYGHGYGDEEVNGNGGTQRQETKTEAPASGEA